MTRRLLPFTKFHGCENDYLILDADKTTLGGVDLGVLSRSMSSRHTGVGADGIIVVHRTDSQRARMAMFNADGSRGLLCGNGLRCVVKYLADDSGGKVRSVVVESDVGLHACTVSEWSDRWASVTVELGAAVWNRAAIPFVGDSRAARDEVTVEVRGEKVMGTPVSVGNPHCVFFLERSVAQFPLQELAVAVRREGCFPDGVNVEVAQVGDRGIEVRTWERGSGETRACGSGACAVAAVAHRAGLAGRAVKVHLRGGTLDIELGEPIRMTGRAERVFDGTWNLTRSD